MITQFGFRNILYIFMYLICSSCISVKLTPSIEKAKNIRFNTPGGSFEPAEIVPADQAWKSKTTGNTISYFSECVPGPVNLERMRDDVLLSLPSARIISSELKPFDGREGLTSLIEGKVDGIPVRMMLLVYQKNGCRYSLSLSGRSETFNEEINVYQRFTLGFKAL